MGVIIIPSEDLPNEVALTSAYDYNTAEHKYRYRANLAKQSVSVSVTGIPSGARVTRAVMEVTVTGQGGSGSNLQVCTAYGVDVRSDNGAPLTNVIRLDLRGNRIVNVEFCYQMMNGTMEGMHYWTVRFKISQIRVEYLEDSEALYYENEVIPPAKEIMLYKPHETNFEKNGIMLHPMSCEVTESDAGEYTLSMTYPFDPDGIWRELQEEYIVDAPVPPHKIPSVSMPVMPLWRVKTTVENTPLYSRLPTYTKAKTDIDKICEDPQRYAWNSTTTYSPDGIYQVTCDGHVYYAVGMSTGARPPNGPWRYIRPVTITPGDSGSGTGTYNPGTITEYLSGGTTVTFIATYNSTYVRVRSPLGVTGYAIKKDLEQTGTDSDPIEVPERTVRTQRFRIKNVTCDEVAKTVSISAVHISYDLQHNSLFDCQMTEEQPATAIAMLQGSMMDDDSRLIVCPIEYPLITANWSFKNPMVALLDPEEGLAGQLQAKVLRDNADFFLLSNETMRVGPKLAYGVNLMGVTWTRSTSDLVTRVIPRAGDGQDGYMYLDGLFVDSDHINEYAIKYIEVMDSQYSVGQTIKKADGTEKTLSRSEVMERMLAEAEDRFYLDNADQAVITLDVEFLLLGDTEEYKQYRNLQRLCLYDRVLIETGNTTVTAQVRGYTWDCLAGMYKSISIGKVFSQNRRKMPGYRMANGTITYSKLSPGLIQQIRGGS